jgi:leucyl aminopeptidase (aminopeptidase T)
MHIFIFKDIDVNTLQGEILKSLGFMKTADIITGYFLNIKPGEEVLVIKDTRMEEFLGAQALVEAVMSSICIKGAEAQMITFLPRALAGEEPPKITAAAMKSADAFVAMPCLSILQTVAMTEALATGARAVMLPAARYILSSLDMLYRLMPTDTKEIDDTVKLVTKVSDIFKKGKQIVVSSPKGTNIRINIGDLQVNYNPNTCHKPGERTIVPGGQILAGATLGTAEGKVVIDGSASPLYRPLSEPIEMTVEKGYVTKIEGGRDANEYRELLGSLDDRHVYAVAEIGVGCHPKARLSGTPLEDERIYGAMWIAIGTNVHIGGSIKAKIHSDCVMLPPITAEVDGQTILENSNFKI